MFQELMLVIAVCTDMFFTAFSYGKNGIKIPVISSVAVSFTGALILSLALKFSETIGKYIPEKLCIYAGAFILFSIGCIYLLKNFIKSIMLKKADICKNQNTHIQIFFDECNADKDNSKVLSIGEAFLLSVSLSVDSLASGIGAGLTGSGVIRTGIMALIGGIIVMTAGEFFGCRLNMKSKSSFSWIGGAVLIILAVMKIIR